jgi:exosortase A
VNTKWKSHGLVWLGVCAALAAAFYPTLIEVGKLWFDTESYAHGIMVPFISLWLAWRVKGQIARNIQPSYWALGAVAGIASAQLWFVGEVLQISSFRHFSVVLLLIASIGACFGKDLFRALLFPILFLLFAVPFGDFLIEPMMDQTADAAVIALQWTGIPVYREARSIQIPSGRWAVVEACAGTRYLVASVMLGALYSYLFYRSWTRRVVFMFFAIIVPIVANWLRAYLIIMAGHLSENTIGVGADHILFGWVFFGALIFAMFSIGAKWREDSDDRPQFSLISKTDQSHTRNALIAVMVATVFSVALPTLASRLVPSGQPLTIPSYSEKPGWSIDARELWAPEFSGERARLNTSYRPKNGVSITTYRGVFEAQRGQNRMLRYGNRFYPEMDTTSAKIKSRVTTMKLGGKDISVIEYKVPERVGVRVIRGFYQVGQSETASAYAAKLKLAIQLLTGGGDRSSMVMWSAYSIEESQALTALAEYEAAFGDELIRREP